MKKLLLLTLALASFAAAQDQYSYTFTAPVGAISCSTYNTNIVYPVANGVCPEMQGFLSPDNLYKLELQDGQTIVVAHITSVVPGGPVQTIEAGTPVWTVPSTFPAEGVPATFSMVVTINSVCNAGQACVPAVGQLDLTGQWAWKNVVIPRHGTIKVWTNTSPVVVTGLSTVAILD